MEAASSDGLITTISIAGMIGVINLEKLSQEEVNIIRSKQDRYPVHVSHKRVEYGRDTCVVDIYRIIILPQANSNQNALDSNLLTAQRQDKNGSGNNYLLSDAAGSSEM